MAGDPSRLSAAIAYLNACGSPTAPLHPSHQLRLLLLKTVVSLFKNRSGIVSHKKFNCYVDQNKKIPQYDPFRCGRVDINNSLKKIEFISYNLQLSLLKQEVDHDEIYEDTWEDKENESLFYLKNDGLSTAFPYAKYAKRIEELTGFAMKNSKTLPSLTNRYFNTLR